MSWKTAYRSFYYAKYVFLQADTTATHCPPSPVFRPAAWQAACREVTSLAPGDWLAAGQRSIGSQASSIHAHVA
jgi:hypothetical protein